MPSLSAVTEGFRLMESEMKSAPTPKPSKDSERVARWSALFGDMDDAEFQRVCLVCLQTRTFWPTPAEFRECQTGDAKSRDAQADLAFDRVRRAISRYGTAASLTAGDLDGDACALWAAERVGIEQIGLCDAKERTFRRAEFRQMYLAAKVHGYRRDYLAGPLEVENRARGFDTATRPELCGRPDLPPLALPGGGKEELPERTSIDELAGRALRRMVPAS